jgi:spermidine/putrescine transport system ATP-binding protein
MVGQSLLRLKELRKWYGPNEILRGIDLEIADGEFLTIVGPSGSGKTTILRLIGGFAEPSSGDILFEGKSVVRMPIFRRPFNTVFQDYALFPHLTVNDNVAYGLKVRRTPRATIDSEVARTLALVDLQDFGGRYPHQLSGGQQQRVALARAIICKPRIILLDEPLGALDPELRRRMQEFLKALQRTIRTTFVFITHDQEEAITMADRICVMRGGRLVQVGTPHEVYYQPADEYVARFFGDNNLIDGRLGRRDGDVRVIETSMGAFRCTVARDAGIVSEDDGSAAAMVVRPEAIRPLFRDEGLDNSIEVHVDSLSFAGANSEIRIRPVTEPDRVLKMRVPSSAGDMGFVPGEIIRVGWSTADCRSITG